MQRNIFLLLTCLAIMLIPYLLLNNESLENNKHSLNTPKPTKFVSQFLQNLKNTLINATPNANLKKLIQNCMLNTLDTTVIYNSTEAFVITGDINAMWLRDSTNQLHPFVQFVKNDSKINWLVQRVIARQAEMIRADPYANAFNYEPQSSGHSSDWSQRLLFGGIPFNAIFDKSIVFERKYEIDSLAAFLRLSNEYFKWSKNSEFVNIRWVQACERILKVIQQQRLSIDEQDENGDAAYAFSRSTSEPTDTLSHARGSPTAKCGLIRSAFRPSDDATVFQYFIPGNAMIQTQLQKILILLKNVSLIGYDSRVKSLINTITPLQQQLKDAIYKYGLTKDSKGRDIFAYEVDCFGNVIKMDDANSPSLLGLPYLGFISQDDQIYKNTRQFVWSSNNPYFFKGSKGQGIGGPHAGHNKIWPMSIIIKGLTSKNTNQIAQCLGAISNTTANTFFMHQSFNKDNDFDYTRSWFAWANTMFGHFILKIYRQYPDILKNF